MKKLILALLFISSLSLSAQVSTPGTGVNWDLDSLVANFPSAFSLDTGIYYQTDDLIVAKNDSLILDNSLVWKLDSGVRVTVEARATFRSEGNLLLGIQMDISAFDSTKTFDGFRFEDSSKVYINNTFFSYGGGLRVLTGDFEMINSEVSYSHSKGTSTSGALGFSRGKPRVIGSTFRYNAQPAMGAGANSTVSATIKYNLIQFNNLNNANRPQINLGPTHPNDTTRIIGNSIIGDTNLTKAGGISVSTLLSGFSVNAIIDSNVIADNRYGITMYGATYGLIRYNTIRDNDSEPNPLNGGSGIALYATNGPVIATRNEISGNYWGVTLISGATINLGDTVAANFNEGKNTFSNNGNGGITYALYNNTSNPIRALNNCWTGDTSATLADAENVIVHMVDDASLGEVFFDPIWKCTDENVSTDEETASTLFSMYPNPAQDLLSLDLQEPQTIRIYNLTGTLMNTYTLEAGHTELNMDLKSGLYLVKTSNGGQTHKLLID